MAFHDLRQALAVLRECSHGSPIATAQLRYMLQKIAGEYTRLAEQVPRDHAWRWGKLADSAKSMQDANALALKHQLDEKLTGVLELVAFAADIGRLNVLIEHGQGAPEQENHGDASVRILSRIFGVMSVMHSRDSLWQAVLLAVKHHSDLKTPGGEVFSDNEAAFYLCLILRDLDKMGGWIGKGRMYVQSRNEINRQMKANGVVEEGFIPESVIACFERGEPIDRKTCETYAGFMLQFLAWKFDFNFAESWDQVKEDGAPAIVLDYIRDQLVNYGNVAQWRRVKDAANKHNIATLD